MFADQFVNRFTNGASNRIVEPNFNNAMAKMLKKFVDFFKNFPLRLRNGNVLRRRVLTAPSNNKTKSGIRSDFYSILFKSQYSAYFAFNV